MAVRISLGIKSNRASVTEKIESLKKIFVVKKEAKGYLVEAEGDPNKITEEIKKIEGVIILSVLHLT